MGRLTIGHFAATGRQDCGNTLDATELRDAWVALGRPSDPEAAINVVRHSWGDDSDAKVAWLDQCDEDAFNVSSNPRDGKLDPEACYIAWRDAWQTCAVAWVKSRWAAWNTCSACERVFLESDGDYGPSTPHASVCWSCDH